MNLAKTAMRAIGALRLNEDALYEIGIDRRETGPAVLLCLGASLGAGLTWLWNSDALLTTLAAWLGFSVLALGLIGEVAYFMAVLIFGGGVQRSEIIRLAGFAMLPLTLASIPYLGILATVWAIAIYFKGITTYFAMRPGRAFTLVVFSIGAAFVFWALANAIVYAIGHPG